VEEELGITGRTELGNLLSPLSLVPLVPLGDPPACKFEHAELPGRPAQEIWNKTPSSGDAALFVRVMDQKFIATQALVQ
jgi:hypothetical protein